MNNDKAMSCAYCGSAECISSHEIIKEYKRALFIFFIENTRFDPEDAAMINEFTKRYLDKL